MHHLEQKVTITAQRETMRRPYALPFGTVKAFEAFFHFDWKIIRKILRPEICGGVFDLFPNASKSDVADNLPAITELHRSIRRSADFIC